MPIQSPLPFIELTIDAIELLVMAMETNMHFILLAAHLARQIPTNRQQMTISSWEGTRN